MRIVVFSDVHGNKDALIEVIRDMHDCDIDSVVCLGDNIGYGPESEDVVQMVKNSSMSCIIGNHDLAAVDPSRLNRFNPIAARSLETITGSLSPSSISFLGSLGRYRVENGCRFVHGCPPDSVETYLFLAGEEELRSLMRSINERICFVGHTHELEFIELGSEAISREYMENGIRKLSDGYQYIINVGSVGQPRDGNNNAKYVIWDSLKRYIEVRYVSYDIAAVVRKIESVGLPGSNGDRLW